MVKNTTHPLHRVFADQRSAFSDRLRSLPCSTERLRTSIAPSAIRLSIHLSIHLPYRENKLFFPPPRTIHLFPALFFLTRSFIYFLYVQHLVPLPSIICLPSFKSVSPSTFCQRAHPHWQACTWVYISLDTSFCLESLEVPLNSSEDPSSLVNRLWFCSLESKSSTDIPCSIVQMQTIRRKRSQ